MVTHPAQLLFTLLMGLVSATVLGLAVYMLYRASRPRRIVHIERPAGPRSEPRVTGTTADRSGRGSRLALLVAGLAMLLLALAGKHAVAPFFSHEAVASAPSPSAVERVRGVDGSELAVAHYGPRDGPALVFTHGWGADRRDWLYAIAELPPQTRVVVWDLPGLGQSSARNDLTMPAMAGDLDRVVSSLGDTPVVLVGHSIGGMLNLEYARRFPEKMGRQVKGLVQANTTYTNPIETKKNAETSRKLQKPLFEPLLRVVTWTSPVARALGWLAYRSGLAHLQLASQSFAGAETWQQLDEMARYAYRSSPRVVAEGVLAMLHWDATDALARIQVPTLVISGNEDVTTLPAASDRMASSIPAAARLSVERAAHLGPVEQSGRYASAIADFAARATGGRPPVRIGALELRLPPRPSGPVALNR